MIDTHTHIYLPEFDEDRLAVIVGAQAAGVSHIILPNVDIESIAQMIALYRQFPLYCSLAAGLHPTAVTAQYEQQIATVWSRFSDFPIVAIGEIGTDFYWDQSFKKEQMAAFDIQIEMALQYKLPVIIHQRNSFEETLQVIESHKGAEIKGVFHSFTGDIAQAERIFDSGDFYLGINGIVTFKNTQLPEVIKHIGIERLVLETDAPYLAPIPFRGKRNAPEYIPIIASKVSEILQIDLKQVMERTHQNAENLFAL